MSIKDMNILVSYLLFISYKLILNFYYSFNYGSFILKKLKELTQEDLNDISEYFSHISNNQILFNIPSKEISDLDIYIDVKYENRKLDVDIDVDIQLDEFSNAEDKDIDLAIKEAYLKLDEFIDENYRE